MESWKDGRKKGADYVYYRLLLIRMQFFYSETYQKLEIPSQSGAWLPDRISFLHTQGIHNTLRTEQNRIARQICR